MRELAKSTIREIKKSKGRYLAIFFIIALGFGFFAGLCTCRPSFVKTANKYFDTETPWITRTSDQEACRNTLYQCVQMIANLAVLLRPFLPFSSEKICGWLSLDDKWQLHEVQGGYHLPKIQILFERIDKSAVETETEKLSLL